MKKFYFFIVILMAFSGIEKVYSQVNVIYTVKDESDTIGQVFFGGDLNYWAKDPMYDDGTHGDSTAGDHVWTITYSITAPDSTTTNLWGVYDVAGNWLIPGPTPVSTVTPAGVVSGNYYDIVSDPRNINMVVTYKDIADTATQVDLNTSADGWKQTTMYDDGTHGDATSGDHVWSVTINAMVRRSYLWNVFINNTWTDIGSPYFTVSADGCVTGNYNFNGDSTKTCYKVMGGSSTGTAIKNASLSNISIYPNPVTDQLTINTGNTVQSASIINVFGQVIETRKFNSATVQLNFSRLSQGMYFIRVKYSNGSLSTYKVIKK